MANGISGSKEIACSSGFYLRVNYRETYDLAANTSDFYIDSIEVKSTQYSGYAYYCDGILKIDGTAVKTMDSNVGGYLADIIEKNKWYTITNLYGSKAGIAHGTDGAKTITIEFAKNRHSYFDFYSPRSTASNGWHPSSTSFTVALTSIPRASDITGATSVTVNGSNSSTVTISPKVSTYSHKIIWSIGSYNHSESVAAGTNSKSYVIPNDWKSAFPNAKSGTASVKVETYSGTTKIGEKTTSITLSCNGTETPNFTLSESDANGIYSKIGCYVSGQSKYKASVSNLTYQYGASYKSVKISIGSESNTGYTTLTARSNVGSAGNTTISATLTDSRGYTKTITHTVTAYNYTKPSLSLSISRYSKSGSSYVKDDEGGYGNVYYTSSISNIGSNAIQSIVITYRTQDGSSGGGSETLTSATGNRYYACDIEKVYNFTVSITDKLNTVVYGKQLSSAVTIMDVIRGGNGLCIGGVATRQGAFDERLPMYLEGHDSPVGSVVNSGSRTISASSSQWVETNSINVSSGIWLCFECVAFSSNANGMRAMQSTRTGDTEPSGTSAISLYGFSTNPLDGTSTVMSRTRPFRIEGSATIKLWVFQNSGSAINVTTQIYAVRLA